MISPQHRCEVSPLEIKPHNTLPQDLNSSNRRNGEMRDHVSELVNRRHVRVLKDSKP